MNDTACSPAKSWTPPFHGITHYGAMADHRRATINIVTDNFIVLKLWVNGGGFNPTQKEFSRVEDAKSAGEAWANSIC